VEPVAVLGHDRRRRFPAPIVYHDDLEERSRVALGGQRLEAAAESMRAVVGRDDHREEELGRRFLRAADVAAPHAPETDARPRWAGDSENRWGAIHALISGRLNAYR
jgi:hypothetical protein